jgi:tetratricopeptide (TPR) repeat protein
LNQALLGDFRAVRGYLDDPSTTAPGPVKSYLRAQQLAASDKIEEAVEPFEEALESTWPEFRVIATAELYKHFSLTGNRYKADQLWEDIRERDTSTVLKEFLAFHLARRRYEKQAHYLYKSLYRSTSGRPEVLKALWDKLADEDPDGLGQQVKSLLAVDPLDCDANELAMRYFKMKEQNRELVYHGRNVVLYCYDVVEPYFELATALLSLSKPDEARTYFGKYVKSGGDKTRIPTYMR